MNNYIDHQDHIVQNLDALESRIDDGEIMDYSSALFECFKPQERKESNVIPFNGGNHE